MFSITMGADYSYYWRETWSRQVRTSIYAQFSTCSMVTLVDHIDVVFGMAHKALQHNGVILAYLGSRRMVIKAAAAATMLNFQLALRPMPAHFLTHNILAIGRVSNCVTCKACVISIIFTLSYCFLKKETPLINLFSQVQLMVLA